MMLEAQNTGEGLVILFDIEPVEFNCETLKAEGLISSIEPEYLRDAATAEKVPPASAGLTEYSSSVLSC